MKECPKYVAEGGNIHAEVEYMKDENTPVHSDICPSGCSMTGVNWDYEYLLVNALKEWLKNSKGTGYFYVGNWDDIAEAFGNTITSGVESGVELHG
tara:strand:- start:534 stop:821 length:288 start_codon:yes stop_codon:yes gene_type:complete